MKKLGLLVVIFALCIVTFAQNAKQKKESNASDVTISVVRDTSGKPVRNATVVLHPVNDDGKQDSGGINLKTDQDGKTGYQGLPYGKLRIQVIAHGFQTFGDDFEINQAQQEVVVKMKPPRGQYSIYDDQHKPAEPKK